MNLSTSLPMFVGKEEAFTPRWCLYEPKY